MNVDHDGNARVKLSAWFAQATRLERSGCAALQCFSAIAVHIVDFVHEDDVKMGANRGTAEASG